MVYNQTFIDYCKYISGIERLDTYTERTLIEKAQKQDKKALNKLVETNLYLILAIVKGLLSQGKIKIDNAMDCMQQGSIGLIQAIKKFDLSMDNKLATYAIYWIWQQIKEAIQKESTIKIPNYVYNNKEKVIDLDNYRYLKSLNENINNDTDTQLQETIPSTINTENEVLTKTQKNEVNTILINILTPRDADIIKRRFGFYGEKETLESIGKRYNITREAVRLVENKALQKLKDNSEIQSLYYQ